MRGKKLPGNNYYLFHALKAPQIVVKKISLERVESIQLQVRTHQMFWRRSLPEEEVS